VLTLAAAVAVGETLELGFQVPADIKWPNDVMASGRKICGILVESAIEGDRLQYAVIGIGVNIAQQAFPDEISRVATSLRIETGRLIAPEEFARPLLEHLAEWYDAAVKEPARLLAKWEALSSYAQGCVVQVESSDWSIEGVTRGLASTGALRVELADGEIREVFSGEVSLRARTVSG
jgi:BirA family biotin operon repressor/biotin-[acetyl-CoA-carboxylase] ligase